MTLSKPHACRALALFGLIAWIPIEASAADPAKIDVKVATDSPVFVGQRVDIQVKLMTDTTFASAPTFELPRMPNAVLMHVDDRPVLGTEEIEGTTYTTQLHSLVLYCLKAGTCAIPAFTVRFESASQPGQPAVEHSLKTAAFEIAAQMPAGAENLATIICSQQLSVSESWQPDPKEPVPVGASFKRQVTQTASDVPAMIMPPVPLATVDGLTPYPQPPLVQDQSERGQTTGTRTDSVIYVCERPGKFTLPAMVIPWWDLENKQLAREMLPAITIDVQPLPTNASTPDAATTSPTNERRWLPLVILGAIILSLLALFTTRQRWMAVLHRQQSLYRQSERGLFAAIEAACNADDAIATYNALLKWLDLRHAGSGSATIGDDLLSKSTNPVLHRQVDQLQAAVLSETRTWQGHDLLTSLQKCRRELVDDKHMATDLPLPTLNPR